MSKIDVKQIVDVGKVIVDVLDKEAAKTSTDITSDDVSKVAPKLEAEVKKEIAKEVQPGRRDPSGALSYQCLG
jgi:hypothetical protein